MAVAVHNEREAFEKLVAATAYRPRSPEALRLELKRQVALQSHPSHEGLDDLAAVLAGWLGGERDLDRVTRLTDAHPDQPLIHYHAFAMRREACDLAAARASLAALVALDPGDPLAVQLAAGLAGETVPIASEETRLANLAKLATTALLSNPYQLAVGAIFEAIRDRRTARVLDVGVGGGAQLAGLLALLGARDHDVRRVELVGLDFKEEFLERAGQRIAASIPPKGVEVAYIPIRGRVEELDDAQVRAIAGDAGLDAANATIALHEVPGERKLTALRNLRRLQPRHLVIAEWNYCLENTLPETSVEFLFNVRQASSGFVAALAEHYPHDEARAVVRDWLSQGGGQMTCPAESRQECFLHVASWQALLERTGLAVAAVDERWLAYADRRDRARVADGGTWLATSSSGDWSPIALVHAVPA